MTSTLAFVANLNLFPSTSLEIKFRHLCQLQETDSCYRLILPRVPRYDLILFLAKAIECTLKILNLFD